ncbi:MAG: molybdenum cofactor guanylyltransferase [Acidobacteriaceae bacterium]
MGSQAAVRSNPEDSGKDFRAQISGFVLAGGRSGRMGEDKVLLPWPGQDLNKGTLLDHAVARLKHVCATVSICANREFPGRGETVIPDARAGCGPLGGIVAALEQSATEWNIFLAVDLPFLPVEALEAQVARVYRAEEGPIVADNSSLQQIACVIPQLDGRPQPLCGLYRRSLASGLRHALEKSTFKVITALQEALIHSIRDRQGNLSLRIDLWDASDFAAKMNPAQDPTEWFLNVNTPEDWRRARQLRLR